jgi:hypothetical protein
MNSTSCGTLKYKIQYENEKCGVFWLLECEVTIVLPLYVGVISIKAADLRIASHQFHSGPHEYELISDSAIVLLHWMCLAHVATRVHLSSIQSTAVFPVVFNVKSQPVGILKFTFDLSIFLCYKTYCKIDQWKQNTVVPVSKHHSNEVEIKIHTFF